MLIRRESEKRIIMHINKKRLSVIPYLRLLVIRRGAKVLVKEHLATEPPKLSHKFFVIGFVGILTGANLVSLAYDVHLSKLESRCVGQ